MKELWAALRLLDPAFHRPAPSMLGTPPKKVPCRCDFHQCPVRVSLVLGPASPFNTWMHKVNQRGLGSLKAIPRPGRPPRLTAEVAQEVEQHLEKAPLEFGINRVRWDGPTLVVHLKRQFGIKLKVRQAQNWMHRVGYRLKRASYSYLQAKAEDAKRFRRALKKTPIAGA